jgi:hypothetical protein
MAHIPESTRTCRPFLQGAPYLLGLGGLLGLIYSYHPLVKFGNKYCWGIIFTFRNTRELAKFLFPL